jgi:hypothetical protein
MKSPIWFFLFFLIVGLTACSEMDEKPVSPLIGVWENRVYVDSTDYWIITSLDFETDSTYENRITIRKKENGPDLGYRFVMPVRYTIDGSRIAYSFDIARWIDTRGPLPYAPKEDLIFGFADYWGQPMATLTFYNQMKELDFLVDCQEGFIPCPLAVRYYKVN